MSLLIPDDVVQATRMSADELRLEIAILLFIDKKLTLGQAARLASMSQPDFQRLLAQRHVPLHYDIADFRRDVETLEELDDR